MRSGIYRAGLRERLGFTAGFSALAKVKQRTSKRKIFNLYGVMLYRLPVGFVWTQSGGMHVLPDNGPTLIRIRCRRAR